MNPIPENTSFQVDQIVKFKKPHFLAGSTAVITRIQCVCSDGTEIYRVRAEKAPDTSPSDLSVSQHELEAISL